MTWCRSGRDDAPSRLDTVEQRPFPQRPPLAGAGRHWQQKAAASDDQHVQLNPRQDVAISMTTIDLLADWERYVRSELSKRGYDVSGINDLPSLGRCLFNAQSRDIAQRPRVVHHPEGGINVAPELITSNWPQLLDPFRVDAQLASSVTEDDIKTLRKAGVNTFVTLSTGNYAPRGGGLTSARTSVAVAMKEIHYRSSIRKCQNHVLSNVNNFLARIEHYGHSPASPPEFKLQIDDRTIGVIEVGSQVLFKLMDL